MVSDLFSYPALSSEHQAHVFIKNLNVVCEKLNAKLIILESYFPENGVIAEFRRVSSLSLISCVSSSPSPVYSAVAAYPVSVAFCLSPLSYINHHLPPTTLPQSSK